MHPFRTSSSHSFHDHKTLWFELVADYKSVDPETTPLRSSNFRFRKISYRSIAVSTFGIFSCIYIVCIESVIYQNDITGLRDVIGAGQLIPLTIGVGSFAVLVVNMVYK